MTSPSEIDGARAVAATLEEDGVAVAAASEELIDRVLHCVVELEEFPQPQRERIRQLVSGLRASPVEAGKAAIRIEQELAPAVPWSDLLAAAVEDRWDGLLSRRRDLTRTLRKRKTRRGQSNALPPAERVPTHDEGAAGMTRKQIRGSGLLLSGRGISSGIKFLSDLIVIRYLAASQYGAWTYALAVVTFLWGLSTLGLHRAISRFLPLHLERDEPEQFYGVLVFVMTIGVLTGGLAVLAFYAFPEELMRLAGVSSTEPIALLYIMIFMVPLETLDNQLLGVCAAFGDSRTIFVRRFILHPGFRLAVAGALVMAQADVMVLAYGWVLSSVVGIGYYAVSVARSLRKQGLLRMKLMRRLQLPIRRVLSYTTPVMAADWCSVFMMTAGPLMLGYFSEMSAVALYQVVVPLAALNTLVHQSFVMLYEPSASRLVGRGDREGLQELYWRFAVWVAVLTFPLFALSFVAAHPLTVTLFGERYAGAAPILSMLALAYFIDAMAGFNAATLRVSGRVKWLIGTNALAALCTIGLGAVLIPRYGPVGAGIGVLLGFLAFMVLKQTALYLATGVSVLAPRHRGPYLTMALAIVGLTGVRLLWPDHLGITLAAAVAASLAVYASARVSLSVSETFPELARFPFLRTVLG